MATKKQQFSSQEALDRVLNNESVANYDAIYNGFAKMGINPDEVEPRVNVFTYNAWLAQGRRVRKGQHGVKVNTFVSVGLKKKDGEEGQEEGKKGYKMARTTTVFHLSQTEEVEK